MFQIYLYMILFEPMRLSKTQLRKIMARSRLDALLTEKTLALLNQNTDLMDSVLSGPQTEPLPSGILEGLTDDQTREVQEFHSKIFVPTKNLCAKVSPQLAQNVDAVCGFLGISKRRFIEASIVDALERAELIIQDEGLVEHFSGRDAA